MARSRGSSGRRTDYTWNGGAFFRTTQTTGGAVDSVAVADDTGTIVRSRGFVRAVMDVGAAGDTIVGGFGLYIASDDQLAAGVTAFPSPILDLDADWMWHSFAVLRSEVGTQLDEKTTFSQLLTIDSKAMRKIRQNQQVVFVGDVSVQSGSPTLDWVVGARILFGT